jgi:hypothetical protein
MDYMGLLKRAFDLTLKHRGLWGLGFLAALAGGSSGSFNGNFNLPGGGSGGSGSSGTTEFERQMTEFGRVISENPGILIGVGAAVLCIVVLLSLVFLVLSEIGHGGLIHNADALNAGSSARFGDGWRAGVSRLVPLVGQRLLVSLPGIIFALVAIGVAAAIFVPLFAGLQGSSGAESSGGDDFDQRMLTAVFGSLCLFIPLICVGVVYNIVAAILNTFGRRAVMLDGAGAVGGLSRGWGVFRANLVHSFVFGLLMWVVQFAVGIIVGIVSLAIIIPVAGVVIATSSSGSSVINPVVIALGILAGVLLVVLSAAINAVVTAYSGTLWTLAYRAFGAAPAANPVIRP